jgi:hypothetical protein
MLTSTKLPLRFRFREFKFVFISHFPRVCYVFHSSHPPGFITEQTTAERYNIIVSIVMFRSFHLYKYVSRVMEACGFSTVCFPVSVDSRGVSRSSHKVGPNYNIEFRWTAGLSTDSLSNGVPTLWLEARTQNSWTTAAQCSYFLLVLASTVILGFGSRPDSRPIIFIRSNTFTFFEIGLHLRREERSDYYSSPATTRDYLPFSRGQLRGPTCLNTIITSNPECQAHLAHYDTLLPLLGLPIFISPRVSRSIIKAITTARWSVDLGVPR